MGAPVGVRAEASVAAIKPSFQLYYLMGPPPPGLLRGQPP